MQAAIVCKLLAIFLFFFNLCDCTAENSVENTHHRQIQSLQPDNQSGREMAGHCTSDLGFSVDSSLGRDLVHKDKHSSQSCAESRQFAIRDNAYAAVAFATMVAAAAAVCSLRDVRNKDRKKLCVKVPRT